MGTYHKCSVSGGSNIYLNLIICEDNIVIPPKLQSCILNWYHTYLPYPGMDITEAKFPIFVLAQHKKIYPEGIKN